MILNRDKTRLLLTQAIKLAVTACLCITALCTLPGCQLALEEAGPVLADVRLIGLLITAEPINLPATSYLLDDYDDEYVSDGMFTGGYLSGFYQQRIYATAEVRQEVSESGELAETVDYRFEGIDGITFFELATDNATDSLSFTGTIFSQLESSSFYYMYPVYQSGEGSVFLVVNIPNKSSSSSIDYRMVVSDSMSSSYTFPTNSLNASHLHHLDYTIEIVYLPADVGLIQIDSEGNTIAETVYDPNNLPDQLTLEPGADHLVIESIKVMPDGEHLVSRTIIYRDDGSFTYYIKQGRRFMQHQMAVDWQD